MVNTTLAQYASGRLKAGDTPEAIKSHLTLVGWTEEDAGEAVVAGLLANGVPAPERGAASRGGGRVASTVEVVLNFFSFILLATAALSLGILYYNIINKYFPDALTNSYGYDYGYSAGSINYAIAALVIAFPIYALTVYLWFKRFREDAEKVESKLTKWLTYLVLLVTSVTIVGDLIATVFYFLQGELSARFVLKALTIFVISGIIFGFYFLERRKIQYKQDIARGVFKAFGWAVALYIILGIILGFSTTGSPETQRARALDSQRANDLSGIANCVSNFAQLNKRLPLSLDELSASGQNGYCYAQMTDPETGATYEYEVLAQPVLRGEVREAGFELCAVFTLAASENTEDYRYSSPQNKWAIHAAGRDCDTENVTLIEDKQVAPPIPKGSPVAPVPAMVQ